MAEIFVCQKTGIRFEGELVAKELGIQGQSQEQPRHQVTTEQGITFQGEELPPRVAGELPGGGSIFSYLMPERPKGVRLMNRTMQDVMQEWEYQAGRHQDAEKRQSEGMRWDPVTKRFY
ncbi:MAG: hypothetical protein KIT09_10365 [Bryobacteraceae bacterium]|nr:hypothetical protein [Bryobacteraceae bacterium]